MEERKEDSPYELDTAEDSMENVESDRGNSSTDEWSESSESENLSSSVMVRPTLYSFIREKISRMQKPIIFLSSNWTEQKLKEKNIVDRLFPTQ